MKNFLKLILPTAALVFSMSVITSAEETIISSGTLDKDSYSDIVITGSQDPNNPVEVEIPSEGIVVSNSSNSQYPACISVKSGYVTIKGGTIYHKNASTYSTSIIDVAKGANLKLDGVRVEGVSKENVSKPLGDNIPITERSAYMINNAGSVELTGGTVLDMHISPSYMVMCSAINNKGKLVISDAVITNVKPRGGSAIFQINNGAASEDENSSTVIKKAVMYNCITLFRQTGGKFEINGGLMTGSSTATNTGVCKTGPIEGPVGDTVYDKTSNISIPITDSKALLTAHPGNNIVTEVNGKQYMASYYSGKWYFLNVEENEHNHEVKLDVSSLNLIVDEEATITATVFCIENENHIGVVSEWKLSDDSGVVEIKGNGNTCNIKALKAGKATITATTAHSASPATCTIYVKEKPEAHTENFVFENGKTYTDTVVDAGGKEITLTVNGNSYVDCSEYGGNCITVKSGTLNIKSENGSITHKSETAANSIIKIEPGAAVSISGVTIKGNESEKLLYGIENKGYLKLLDGSVLTNIFVNKDLSEYDGIVFNEGDFTLNGGIIYGNSGYAIYNMEDSKSLIQGGLVAGEFKETFKFDGADNFLLGVVSIPTSDVVTVESRSTTEGSTTYKVELKDGEKLLSHKNRIVTAYIDNKQYPGNYAEGTGRWDFIDRTAPVVSYVKGDKLSVYNSEFYTSHIKDADGVKTTDTAVGTTHSICTAFISDKQSGTGYVMRYSYSQKHIFLCIALF